MQIRYWRDLTTAEFETKTSSKTVAILPIAATEQHGPHLPTGTDSFIAAGMLREFEETAERFGQSNDLAVLLPILEVGASTEHTDFPGTLSFSAALMSDQIVAIAEGVAASGVNRLLTISSHGGNVAAMTSAALEVRSEFGAMNVATTWNRLGYPDQIVSEEEMARGIHGGFIETSLMLYFRPDLVRSDALADWPSKQSDLEETYSFLRAHGSVGYGWMAQDLNPAGVVGNAALASADAGAAIAAHQAACLAQLVADMQDADLSDLLSAKPDASSDAEPRRPFWRR